MKDTMWPRVDFQTVVTKRFEVSAAHRVPEALDERETRLHGHDYVLHVGVSGPLDPTTGILVRPAALQAQVEQVLDRYDYRDLNAAFTTGPGVAAEGREVMQKAPTVEAIAESIWTDLAPGFPETPLGHVVVSEDGGLAAAVTAAGTHAIVPAGFAAAHRTHIPTLSDEANRALFGACNNPAGHGHNYRLCVECQPPSEPAARAVRETLQEFDHTNLSLDIADLAGRNATTEVIARLLWDRIQASLRAPAHGQLRHAPPGAPGLRRIRLNELPDFFAEHAGGGDAAYLGRCYAVHAAHRLTNPRLTEAENEALYGKCGRSNLHGHSYRVEVTIAGRIDAATGLLVDLADFNRLAGEVVRRLDGRCLDADLPFFRALPSTGENLVNYLWGELERRFSTALARVRVWETRSSIFEIDRRRLNA